MQAEASRIRSPRAVALGLLLWLIAFALSLRLGAVENASLEIVRDLRLPRALLATAVGAGLAVSGAVLQAVFANPLCEPYVLGISSGATLGAVIGGTLGLSLAFQGMAGSAFAGALLFTGVLLAVSLRPGMTNLVLLLTGVMMGFLGSSLVAVWMAFADPDGIQAAMAWLLGDLSRARGEGAAFALAVTIVLGAFLWSRSRRLDAMLMGEESALALGVDVPRERRNLILVVSLLVGVCVSGGGMIGFVGLIVPHAARRLAGSLHRGLIPTCAVLGAAVLTAADCLARVVARPYELPVGVITALVGVPAFLWVLLARKGSRA